jgi:hypothetical protein
MTTKGNDPNLLKPSEAMAPPRVAAARLDPRFRGDDKSRLRGDDGTKR